MTTLRIWEDAKSELQRTFEDGALKCGINAGMLTVYPGGNVYGNNFVQWAWLGYQAETARLEAFFATDEIRK